MTGATHSNMELGPKRLELMHQLFPKATVLALVVILDQSSCCRNPIPDAQDAAHALGLQVQILHASPEAEFDKARCELGQRSRRDLSSAPG